MRIITGAARGKRLVTPEGRDVRPTPERVKEGLFSALQFDIEGRRVLDLFAGSGQLGLEALSRGAESAVFVDASDSSVKIVKQNIELTGFENKAKVFRSDYASFAAACRDTFDIAFLDPPYNAGLLMPAVKAVLPRLSSKTPSAVFRFIRSIATARFWLRFIGKEKGYEHSHRNLPRKLRPRNLRSS